MREGIVLAQQALHTDMARALHPQRLYIVANPASGGYARAALQEALAEVLAMEDVQQAWIVKLPPAGELPPWLAG